MVKAAWLRYPEIYPKLTAVQARLKTASQLRVPAVNARVQAQINAGGKMLRSGLMFMLARFHDLDNPSLVAAGAAIETLHLATLIHDDVLDHADRRRGQTTISQESGNQAAIYAGDYLFAVYFQLLAEAAPDVANVGRNARVMRRLLLGELDQNAVRRDQPITIHQYLRQISGKTAALFELAAWQGATLSGASAAECQAAARYGHAVGMAFQMTDDLLDYTTTAGKPGLEDLQNGIYTLPVLYALAQAPELQPLLLAAQTDSAARAEAAAQIRQLGLPQAQHLAARYTEKALAALQAFPAGQARGDLMNLTQALLTRRQ
ncbi:polyprenyl synthetase family protein [Lacticaseibacillus suibinensis]|uniref:polyprenyl synthetase family protein n=1 Tax=Lacticaseibacillus suibinensis TaxID=2486011 RepID=UPI000F7A2795|nr:polyprenyl synthetase family protein [Lacticaseibacillus suibinensis]